MPEDSGFLDLWRNSPLFIFEAFRDCAVALIQATTSAYRFAGENHDFPVISAIQLAELDLVLLEAKLHSARAIWKETPIHRYLTRPQPIIVWKRISTRFDGCCYHEVALNFGQHLIDSAWDVKCGNYCKMIQSATGRRGFPSEYLRSLVAHIRSECQAGVEKWRIENPAPQAPLADSEEFVTRKWISEKSGIPEATLRGPKWSKIIGPPDQSEPGKPAKWKKSKALEFIANHGSQR